MHFSLSSPTSMAPGLTVPLASDFWCHLLRRRRLKSSPTLHGAWRAWFLCPNHSLWWYSRPSTRIKLRLVISGTMGIFRYIQISQSFAKSSGMSSNITDSTDVWSLQWRWRCLTSSLISFHVTQQCARASHTIFRAFIKAMACMQKNWSCRDAMLNIINVVACRAAMMEDMDALVC